MHAFGVAFFTCLLSMVLAYGLDDTFYSQYTCPPHDDIDIYRVFMSMDDDEKACRGASSMYYYVDRRMNFQDAKAHCERSGDQLVEIRTDEKHNKIQESVKSLRRRTTVYIGANDMQIEGRFVWNSDDSKVSFPKSWWQKNEPNNFRNEDCLAMRHSGLLNDLRCRKKLTFFCESKV